MTFNLYARHRRSVRLPRFDYTQNGAYFVTICAYNRECLFGEVIEGAMILNKYGKLASNSWQDIARHFPFVLNDLFVVMPNHVHGIINISSRGIACYAPTKSRPNRFGGVAPSSISAIIRSYKSAVTKGINELLKSAGMPIWQRNYYEHVIRDEDDLNSIREYIQFNPQKWLEDSENPASSFLIIPSITSKI